MIDPVATDAAVELASVRLTADEVAAVTDADHDFFPPGVAPTIGEDESRFDVGGAFPPDVDAGWRSLVARELVEWDGTFSALLISMRAVYHMARRGVTALESTAEGSWQRTLYVGPDAGLAHAVGPEGIHTFLAVGEEHWIDGLWEIAAPGIEVQADDAGPEECDLDGVLDELSRVIKVFGFIDSDESRTWTSFDILLTDRAWLLAQDRQIVVPLTAASLRAAFAPLLDGAERVTYEKDAEHDR